MLIHDFRKKLLA